MSVISTGYVLKQNGQTTQIDLTDFTHVVSARVRWKGKQRAYNDERSKTNSSSSSTTYPTTYSGYDFDYHTFSGSVTLKNETGSPQSCSVTFYYAEGIHTVGPYTLNPGESRNFSYNTSIYSNKIGHTVSWDRSPAVTVTSSSVTAVTYCEKTEYYQTEHPRATVNSQQTEHLGTLNDGVESGWYAMAGFIAGQVNTVTHTISGSNQAYVEIEYTVDPLLPAPEYDAPEANYRTTDTEINFDFVLTEDTDNSASKYHARIRFSAYSVMTSPVSYESKVSQTNWYYWDGDSWEPFPAGGVDPDTLVRFTRSGIPLGTQYWDATSWDGYGYGYASSSRKFRVLVTVSGLSYFEVEGVEYLTFGLKVVETSNGEIGEIVATIDNTDGVNYASINYGDGVIAAFNDDLGNSDEFVGIVRGKEPRGNALVVRCIMGDGILTERLVKEDYAEDDVGASVASMVTDYCSPLTVVNVDTETGHEAPVAADDKVPVTVLEEIRRNFGLLYFVDNDWDLHLYLVNAIAAAEASVSQGYLKRWDILSSWTSNHPGWYTWNTKLIDICKNANYVNTGSGSQAQDVTNQVLEGESLKMLIPDASAAMMEAKRDGVTLDLSKFTDNSASSENDYVILGCYVSNVAAWDSSFLVAFGQDAVFNPSNMKYYYILSGLATGWNFIKIAKSVFSATGTGAWSGIQSLFIQWVAKAGYSGAYISVQYLQLVRKDPSLALPNPFQMSGVRALTINYGEWYVGIESAAYVWKLLYLDTTRYNPGCLLTQEAYSNFIATLTINGTSATQRPFLIWHYNTANFIILEIYNDFLRLNWNVSGGGLIYIETAFPIDASEPVTLKIQKYGNLIKAFCWKNSDAENVTTLSKVLDFGDLAGYFQVGSRATATYGPMYYSNAKFLEIEETELTYSQGLWESDVESWYEQNTKLIAIFKNAECTPGAGTPSQDTTYYLLEGEALRITETTGAGGWLTSTKEDITLDLTKFQNGEANSTSDYIIAGIYVSNVAALKTAGTHFVIRFYQSNPANYITYSVTSGLATGQNFIKIAKSAFSVVGTGAWNNITDISVMSQINAGYAGAYVTFQYTQLVRKDSIGTAPNPFQIDGERDLEIYNYSEWYVGYESGDLVWKLIYDNAVNYDELKTLTPYCDFVAGVTVNGPHASWRNGLMWYANGSNYFYFRIAGDVLQLYYKVNGGDTVLVTKACPIDADIPMCMKIKKYGSSLIVSIWPEGDEESVVSLYQELDYSDMEGYIYISSNSTSSVGMHYYSDAYVKEWPQIYFLEEPQVVTKAPQVTHVTVRVRGTAIEASGHTEPEVAASEKIERLVLIDEGDADVCAAVVAALIERWGREQKSVTGPIPLNVELDFMQKLRIVVPEALIDEDMILQRKEHDIVDASTTITCGDIILSDSELLSRILDDIMKG